MLVDHGRHDSSTPSPDSTRLDIADPLRSIRTLFSIPAPVYLCGNSLGPQPLSVRTALQTHLDKWASLGVAGHFTTPDPWADIEVAAAAAVAPIVGAKPGEVAIMNSLTVNLHLMLTAFYRPHGDRKCIIIEDGAFSTDEYALQTHITARGLDPASVIVRLQPRTGERLLRDQDILSTISDLSAASRLALVLLPGVQYYTGQLFPLAEACRVAREAGVPIGFDLAHAVGNIPLSLHKWGANFAVWCSYKYLNAGPGAVGGVFIHEKHAAEDLPRHAGWWGHDRTSRFLMPRDFIPQRGAPGFQLSNPPVFAIVPVIEAARVFERAGGMEAVRRKSVKLTAFLERLIEKKLGGAVEIVSPRDEHRRGAQLSLAVERVRRWEGGDMHAFNARLEKRGVVCDVREPDVLRVAPAPLYNSFADVELFVDVLAHALGELPPCK
ncbi:unnamed protein product [Chondrus crispus]|uniref:Kynureninase n=1 Tax=Chondrus crispus TaxID=2769 RepID=R7Q9F0_CHOCR|nr:unnamed protein product [Chondrus crispus]CDF34100.1 unnamed protein product [Chondrus crispus]|eukprot:XP_005713919.1 unnamed protein product [Chondrus crispus]